MAEITKPNSPGWRGVTAHYHKVKPRHVSQFTLKSQAVVWAGEALSFTFELPPIKDNTTAQAWITFLYDLARGDNYFVCDVSSYVPSTVSGAPTMQLRLVSPDASWTVGSARLFGITFDAEQHQ
jgi:hypothetical protein